MNNDNLKGLAKKVQGTAEGVYGNVTNDAYTEGKGEAHKMAGDAQNIYGKAEDKVTSIAGKLRGFADTASEDFSNLSDKVNKEIHEKPVKSSLIALGIGFILGALLIR
jgi:uncharacterized protein YjbJ (UPF0337 family)